jgi:threonine dehydratase
MTSYLSPHLVNEALTLIRPWIKETPLLHSHLLDEWMGHPIYFKAEGFQVTGSFKARGAFYAMLQAKKKLPANQFKFAVFSSGNHAQGCSWAGSKLGAEVHVFMPQNTSAIKVQATRSYGANVTLTPTRAEAEAACLKKVEEGYVWLPPFDNDMAICGQGTAALEAFSQIPVTPSALFATCGGGGWLSGTYLAREFSQISCKIYGAEPSQAADATRSFETGQIHRFIEQPHSIADGARTPGVCPRTFQYLQKIDGFFTASEQEIIYWCQWLSHLLKTPVEPTSAVAMAAARQYLLKNKTKKPKNPLLVMLSGGNISPSTYQKIWSHSWLETLPQPELIFEENSLNQLSTPNLILST